MKIRQFRLFTVIFTSIVLSLGILSCKETGGGVTNPDDSNDSDDPVPVATSIEITPDIIDLDHHGGTEKLVATVQDQFGEEITGLSLTWSVEDEEVALVDTDGIVTGIKPGSTLLTVEHDTLSAEVEVNTMLQMNNQCSEAAPFPSQGAVGGNVSFTLDDNSMENLVHPYNNTTHHAYDFDGDGDEDILVFAFNFPTSPDVEQGGKVLVWRNDNGSFTFRTEEVLEPDHVRADHSRQFEVADFNNDGVDDLFVAQHGWDIEPFPGAPDLLFLSDGSGGITEVADERISPNLPNGFTHASAAADIDCDQDIDFMMSDLMAEHDRKATHLYLNDGSANFQQRDAQLPSQMLQSFVSADMCDIDRDGDPDLFLGAWPAPGGTDSSLMLINNGFGEFRHPMESLLPPRPYDLHNHIVDVVCADMDLDGWNDLVLSATRVYEEGRLVIWRNTGDGTGAFEDVTNEWAPNDWPEHWISRTYVADFNADGWPDIFTSGFPGDQQKVYLNTGGNGFVTQASPDPFEELHIIDANNDGKTDLFRPGVPSDPEVSTVLYISN